MEPLFTADIIVAGEPKLYHVTFANEAYIFSPEDGDGDLFLIKRENDAWQVSGFVAPIAQSQATAALDRYLLAQH